MLLELAVTFVTVWPLSGPGVIPVRVRFVVPASSLMVRLATKSSVGWLLEEGRAWMAASRFTRGLVMATLVSVTLSPLVVIMVFTTAGVRKFPVRALAADCRQATAPAA